MIREAVDGAPGPLGVFSKSPLPALAALPQVINPSAWKMALGLLCLRPQCLDQCVAPGPVGQPDPHSRFLSLLSACLLPVSILRTQSWTLWSSSEAVSRCFQA